MELLYACLPKHITEERLRSYAERFGTVLDCKIVVRRLTTADGLVTFSSLEEAAFAWSKRGNLWIGAKGLSRKDFLAVLERSGSKIGGPVLPAPPAPLGEMGPTAQKQAPASET